MTILDDIKQKIVAEYNKFASKQYQNHTEESRKKLGAFYTPPQLSIQMIEKYEDLSGDILDPTAGAGGLIAAAVIAGADPRRCYGIELDPETALLCRERLAKLGVPRSNIKIGDALKDESYNFEEPAETEIYFKVEDLGCCQVKIFVEINGKGVKQKELTIDYSKSEESIKKKFETLYLIFSKADGKSVKLYSEHLVGRLKFMNAFFKKYIGKTIDNKYCVEI